MSLTLWVTALLLSAVAVCWAYVLVQPGMLLCGAQAWVRAWYRKATTRERLLYLGGNGTDSEMRGDEVDTRWWWKPLWGCYLCVAGQWGFWFYLLLGAPAYRAALAHPGVGTVLAALLVHLGFTSITILFAALWRGLFSWSQQQP